MGGEAEALAAEARERLRRMTPTERLAEALALGEAAIEAYAAAVASSATRRAGCSSARVKRAAGHRASWATTSSEPLARGRNPSRHVNAFPMR